MNFNFRQLETLWKYMAIILSSFHLAIFTISLLFTFKEKEYTKLFRLCLNVSYPTVEMPYVCNTFHLQCLPWKLLTPVSDFQNI